MSENKKSRKELRKEGKKRVELAQKENSLNVTADEESILTAFTVPSAFTAVITLTLPP